ncbi:organic cation transporter-like protein [Helicoverpa armigera]|uniref:organic cation transporter-like protein n=1 Tax=Helicoverpa armigera TaxID=29058 RepID=UPI000B36F4CE|nr:organic cation transporter-like protein [Helicoverpa armigera]
MAKGGAKTGPIDPLQKVIGSIGRYQLWIFFLMTLTKFPVAFNQMAILFLSPRTHYLCATSGKNNTCPCPDPQYDTSIFTRTIIMEWTLICDRKWLTSFTQTIFQFGTLLGSVFFGMAADRYGRKDPLLVAVVIQLVCGIGAVYCPDYWSFTFMRFLIGLSVGGTMVTTFVIVMEFVGTHHRPVISALYQVPFNMGHMLLPVFAYFNRDYKDFQLAISVPVVILLSYFCLAPESPRWLLAVKRNEQAIKILERAARMNKMPTDNIKYDIESYQTSIASNQLKKGNILDLFRTPNLRKNIIAMAFNWLTCSYCFYGVSQYVGQLSGNVFINVACSASVTTVGTFASIPLLKIIGRKTIVIIFHLICACCLLVLAAIPESQASVVLASIGVVSSFIVFVVVYLYCTELFPTVVRNAALGFSSMSARIGSMIAPFVIGMRDKALWMPPVIFAAFPLVAAFVTFLLPETKDCELTTTIAEGEAFGKKPPK